MAKDEKDRAGLGDDQGTRVGRPSTDSDRASSGRPTGAGSEAAGGAQEAPIDGHDEEHRSGYGGAGGKPKQGGSTG